MSIITISRGSKSGGQALAEMVGQKLSCSDVLSREVLVKVSEQYNITELELVDAMQQPPHFLERISGNPRKLYLTLIRAALLDYASTGCVVYHGNAGNFLLEDIFWVLKVRLIAPLEQRVAIIQETMKLDHFEATQYIQKVDQDRMRWTRFLYNKDWSDPHHFDLIVNSKTMSLETASETIAHLAKSPEFQRTPERVADMINKTLASHVLAALELNPGTRGLDLTVTADNGEVQISGKLEKSGLKPEIHQVAEGVPSVKKVSDAFYI